MHVNSEMFVDRATVRPDGSLLPLGKIPSPTELEVAGGELVMADDARLLLDRAFYLSGEIPRVTPYEQGLKGQVRATEGGGWGCRTSPACGGAGRMRTAVATKTARHKFSARWRG